VALVTGGARRVGRAIVEELAQAGCDVAIHFHRSGDAARRAAEAVQSIGQRAATVQGDLSDETTWPRVVKETVAALGGLDVLINNASIFPTDVEDTLEGFDASRWERIQRINLTAPTALCHYAEPHLRRTGRGSIVNLCDISANRPWPRHLGYCVSKAGLVAATKALARALVPDVRVNGVAPGIAIFPEDYDESLRKKLVSRVPLGRAGTPEDIAKLVRYLVVEGDYITGQIIPCDGGRSVV
jgi:pteridine reductase